jgi:hypothetical protein
LAKIPKLIWTDKERAIADLTAQGKEFMEIVALGYSKSMVSRVVNALKEGQKPEMKLGVEKDRTIEDETRRPLVMVTGPKTAPIIFKLDRKDIVLDPLELMKQYRYYTEIVKKDGFTESFSEVLTIAVKLLWTSLLDIPITEDLLNAIFYE